MEFLFILPNRLYFLTILCYFHIIYIIIPIIFYMNYTIFIHHINLKKIRKKSTGNVADPFFGWKYISGAVILPNTQVILCLSLFQQSRHSESASLLPHEQKQDYACFCSN